MSRVLVAAVLLSVVGCSEKGPAKRRIEDFSQMEEVRRLEKQDFMAACDGTVVQPPADDVRRCAEEQRRVAIIDAICIHLVGHEPDEHGKLPLELRGKYDDCVASFR
jgi:hypothetical protein